MWRSIWRSTAPTSLRTMFSIWRTPISGTLLLFLLFRSILSTPISSDIQVAPHPFLQVNTTTRPPNSIGIVYLLIKRRLSLANRIRMPIPIRRIATSTTIWITARISMVHAWSLIGRGDRRRRGGEKESPSIHLPSAHYSIVLSL